MLSRSEGGDSLTPQVELLRLVEKDRGVKESFPSRGSEGEDSLTPQVELLRLVEK